ncbi:hypothetical protein [Curtobacterium oceanosedimentum]|uniref:hypothetical protein n=1 Tax=Curtobacterium oceanosedimentum TaxID=465820 RepID=UPI003396076D
MSGAAQAGSTDGKHWTGPIGDEPTMPGYEKLHAETLAAYRDLVDMAAVGNMAGVRAFFAQLDQPMVEQLLLSVIAETAVQIVAHGLRA